MPDWIAVDWTAEASRAWAIRSAGAERSAQGPPAPFSPDGLGALVASLDVPAGLPVLVSGAGLTAPCPVPATPSALLPVACAPVAGAPVHALPDLCAAQPPDLTDGATARAAGFLALNPGWDGVLLCAGPVSAWLHVSAGEVVSLRTAMTGTLAAALAPMPDAPGAAFDDAVASALSRPEALAARLSSARAAAALDPAAAPLLAETVLGLLIGAELAATRAYWLGQPVALLGHGPRAGAYARALAAQGLSATRADGPRMALEGLLRAHARLPG